MSNIIYTQKDRYAVIWTFHNLENNTVKNISKESGYNLSYVNKVLTEYTKKMSLIICELSKQPIRMEEFINICLKTDELN